ncbi:MAG: DNA polymerase/3'-5' exonuclease PolX [Candidatus Woesearchaeota archaeon]|nr:DNA polymerase/3'-5' exonuclease PolX [Candidatus Woesearchaeota archaeon]
MRKNSEVAKILYQIADLLDIQNVQWKPQAYRKAAQSVESYPEDIADVAKERKLKDVPSVGEHIAQKIEEYLTTGKSFYFEKLKKEMPVAEELFHLEGIGPKTIKLLYQKLKIKTLPDLKKAAQQGKISKLEGMGEKKQQQILESIGRLQTWAPHRFLLGEASLMVEDIISYLKKMQGVEKAMPAGSYLRGKETVGDVDVLIVGQNNKKIMDVFVSMNDVAKVLAHGESKSSIRLSNGLQVDARVVNKNQYGSALQYFTGSKEHSVALRKLALKKGLTLSEYGLFTVKGKKRVAGKTEEEIYKKLGMQWMPPEMRENRGEIELALKHKIPKLVELPDISGDFQTQTNWSDGAHSIEEMAKKAQQLGWKFVTITDHVGGMGIVNPLNEKRLTKQAAEIDKAEKKIGIRIFKGAEIDITKNGELALSKTACKKLDVVLMSIHSAFRMPSSEMTKRICTAMEKYPVNVFGHPTGRLINQRNSVEFDADKVFQTAKDNGVFLEINGQPARMDLNDVHVHAAREIGCSFVVSSDAHAKEQLEYVKYGVITARRGWLEKRHVLNTRTLAQIEKVLER